MKNNPSHISINDTIGELESTKCTTIHAITTNQDGEVSTEEFKKAICDVCVGKSYDQFPPGFKTFITNQYKSVDIDGNFFRELPRCIHF